MSIQEILDEIKKFACTYVCLTGGEPLLQKDAPKLIERLLQKDYKICLRNKRKHQHQEVCGKKIVNDLSGHQMPLVGFA